MAHHDNHHRRTKMKENPIQKRILLHCGHGNTRLFRQNVGKSWIGDSQYFHHDGLQWINEGDVIVRKARRFNAGFEGLLDLGGWHTVVVTPEMIGRKLAIYTALEVKTKTGRLRAAQKKFIDLVRAAGGLAGVVRSPEDAEEILKEI
jgi:hypothetical protein